MRLAGRAAWRALGDTDPNPMVGAVIARGSEVLAIGHHRRFGSLHAEAAAIQSAAKRGVDIRGATMYATLEPCAHRGKQPPCVGEIVSAGIGRVVIARRDPNIVAAGGVEALRAAGVAVEVYPEATAMLVGEPFCRRMVTGRAFVVAKWAQTVDGRVATRTGESKWISGERARARVHRLRSCVDVVFTGIGTVMADDPMLTARGVPRLRRAARRVVADTDLDISVTAALVKTARDMPTTVLCEETLATASITADKRRALAAAGVDVLGVRAASGARGIDLGDALRLLGERYSAATVMVEAGPGLLGSFFDAGLVDAALVYVAPMLLGDELARAAAAGRVAPTLSAGLRMKLIRAKRLGDDLELLYVTGGMTGGLASGAT